ncbi:MAG TPA: acetolactate decarboxylase [Longimicrobium sp.]|nr:acetolactate decarboxylase [Longimicrobium sp.]
MRIQTSGPRSAPAAHLDAGPSCLDLVPERSRGSALRRIAAALAALALCGCATAARSQSTLWQLTPVAPFWNGVYDSAATVGELRRHGDLGVGMFARVNGELVVVDGEFYQADSTGTIIPTTDTQPVLFAVLTRWRGGTPLTVDPGLQYCVQCGSGTPPAGDTTFQTTLNRELAEAFHTRNWLYSLRLTGTFTNLVTRSFAEQTPPYQCWTDVVKGQKIHTDSVATGTMVGFLEPIFVGSISIIGYHLHFISEDRTRGGHVLSFTTGAVRLEAAPLMNIQIPVPGTPAYMSADLSRCPPR